MEPGHTFMLSVDALVNFLARFVHPSALVREKYSNSISTMRSTNLKVLGLHMKTVIQRLQ